MWNLSVIDSQESKYVISRVQSPVSSPQQRDLTHYLETKAWIRQMHASFLRLKPGKRIVNVGCGTGDFTRCLASLIPGKCTVIGVDSRTDSLGSAEKLTKSEGMSGRISFRNGDAYKIPVKDG